MKHQHVLSLVGIGTTIVLFVTTSCAQSPARAAVVSAMRCPARPETQFLDSEKAPALSQASMLLIAVAEAQTPNGPALKGRRLHTPTQQQLENTEDKNVVEWNRWNNHVQPDVDRLYDEIMRATTRP